MYIPNILKDNIEYQKVKKGENALIIPERKGFKVIPEKDWSELFRNSAALKKYSNSRFS